jgi:hypothetical protein
LTAIGLSQNLIFRQKEASMPNPRFFVFLLLTGCLTTQGPTTNKSCLKIKETNPKAPYSQDLCYKYYRQVSNPGKFKRECRKYQVSRHPEWPQLTQDLILNGNIGVGMTKEQVEISWGLPKEFTSTSGLNGKHDEWFYGTEEIPVPRKVTFNDDIVISWTEKISSDE